MQQGQLVELKTSGNDGNPCWAYRYRVGGRNSKRVQRGGFATGCDVREALQRALERLPRDNGVAKPVTLAALVEQYLAPLTLEKLQWLLAKSRLGFGEQRAGDRVGQAPGLPGIAA